MLGDWCLRCRRVEAPAFERLRQEGRRPAPGLRHERLQVRFLSTLCLSPHFLLPLIIIMAL